MDDIVKAFKLPTYIPYVLCAQANCRKMPQAAAELVMYLNSAMCYYKLDHVNDCIQDPRRLTRKRDRKKRAQKCRLLDSQDGSARHLVVGHDVGPQVASQNHSGQNVGNDNTCSLQHIILFCYYVTRHIRSLLQAFFND